MVKLKKLPDTVENITTLDELKTAMGEMRQAQEVFATFDQKQVDAIFYEAAMAANKKRIPLARMAVEETGMGIIEDKVIKNHYASEYVYNAYKNTKTCGVIEEDKSYGYKVIAEPMGIVAAVIPTTNPTSTAIFKCLICLKTRNAILLSPHPRAKKCTIEAARIVREAAEKAGAPKGLIRWIEEPTLELSNRLMQDADITLATGGPGMVRAAYSSGKPALGVGPGNVPAIIDSSADIKLAVNSIILSKTFDNGMICASEQEVIALDDVYDAIKEEFLYRGCYFLNKEETERLRSVILINGSLNAKIVGQKAATIAEMAGIEVPPATKLLIGEVENVEPTEAFAHEKLSPILGMYHASTFSDAVRKAQRLVEDGGLGHTSSLYIDPSKQDKVQELVQAIKTCRVLINTPSSQGGIGDLYNFKMAPSLTLGCGTWGGNSVSENVGVKHLMNKKVVANRQENMLWFRTPEKIYFKQGCMPVALDELGHVMGKKRAFIVTDQYLYKNGFTKPVEQKLTEMGIAHASFWDVEPDPTLQCAMEGVKQVRAFEPDVIIAMGGGSAMDAAKVMWVLYEYPDVKFEDMAMDFLDIRKRIYSYPDLGKKAYFVCIPTTSGTGSEVTPFAVITDERTGVKWPLADYELMPNMAIIDVDNMLNQPKGLTAASGLDVLTHCIEAYVSVMASDFSDPSALQAMKLVFEYLPRAYDFGGDDLVARDRMANASCLAGIAFSNAFLGINHSMAHKLGAYHHIPHGIANAVLLPRIIRYNAAEAPTKMGAFSQYAYPHAKARYVEAARYCGVAGKDDDEVFENFIKKIEELIAHCDCAGTIKEHGVSEEDFLATLDEMVEQAFNDQCTSANPRYPLMSEMKELYLDAFYGREPSSYED